jgi:integrase
LVDYFDDSDVTRLNETHVEQYITWRSGVVADGTLKREVGALSAAFNHAIKKQKWRIENPCLKAEIPKEPKGRVRYLTRPEAKRLLQAAELPYLADFIELALNTGCRKGELLNLKWENIDFSTRLIYLDQTKSGDWQTVPINEEARQVLVRRMRLREQICPNSRWVFFHMVPALNSKVGDRVKNIRKSFKSACNRAGIENFRIHDLRHTFASWLVMKGVPLFEVSKLLRHASIQMTERYAHLAPDHLHDAVASIKFSAHDKFGAETGQ